MCVVSMFHVCGGYVPCVCEHLPCVVSRLVFPVALLKFVTSCLATTWTGQCR